MKKIFFLLGLFLIAHCEINAQISRAATEQKIDSLLPVNTAKLITPLRMQTAFRKVLDYVQPSNFTNQSIDLSKLSPSSASSGQVIKWNGTAWVPSADATGGSPAWGNISGTLSTQPDLQAALNAKEPLVTVGTTSQYRRGDKTWQTLDKAAVGLGNVDNTSDANKPVSTAVSTALAAKANATHSHTPSDITQAGAATGQVLKWNGTAWAPSADATGGSPAWGGISGTLSTQTDLQAVLNAKEPLVAVGTTSQYRRGDKTWQTLDKAAVGLGNVDNTSDANKPVSTAVSSALAAKANATHSHTPSDITQAGAATGQVLKWNGTAWTPSADATGGSPTWGGISGTLSTQADLKTALAAGFVLPEHFGASANGVTDDAAAIQNAINFARDNGLVLRLSPVSYKIANTLINQHDGNYKRVKIIGQGATLLCDTKGKTAIDLTGGYALTEISDLNLKYVGSDTNSDVLTNGLVATNVRCYLNNVTVDGFLCDGFQFSSISPNMNSSSWEKLRSDNNRRYGFYVSGTDDNISVTKGSLYCENNGYSGIYVTDNCMLRDAELFIYAENNCQLNQQNAGVYLGKIRNSRLTIYSEQTNSAEEIRLGANSSDNQVFSFRNNKDYFSGTNTGYRGNRIYQQDASRASTPIVLRADYARAGIDGEYVKMDLEGVNINYGSLKGENDGVYLVNGANKIGTTANRVKINTTQPALINGAFEFKGDASSVASYINGDLSFRQSVGNNVYLDLSTASEIHGGFKIRSSNSYATRFEVKPEGQVNLGPLSIIPTASSAGDVWYNSNTGKFQAHEGGAKNFLTTYTSGLGSITLASGVGTATITGLASTDKAFVQLVAVSGTLGVHYKAVCSANTLTITSINSSGVTVTTDNSTLSFVIVK